MPGLIESSTSKSENTLSASVLASRRSLLGETF